MTHKHNRYFSLEERERIEKMAKNGFGYIKIAKELGRSRSGVLKDIQKNGGYSQYNAEKAQQLMEKARAAGRYAPRLPFMLEVEALKQRVSELETKLETTKMLLDIVLDEFEKKKGT